QLLPDDESASVPLLTSPHSSYAGDSDAKSDEKHEHAITVYIPSSDTKEEKTSAQQKKPTIASLSLHRDNLKKGVAIITAAITQINNAKQVMQRRQTRLGKLTFFIVEFILVATLGGLAYGCSQECYDKNPAMPGYVAGLSTIGCLILILMCINDDFKWCFK